MLNALDWEFEKLFGNIVNRRLLYENFELLGSWTARMIL